MKKDFRNSTTNSANTAENNSSNSSGPVAGNNTSNKTDTPNAGSNSAGKNASTSSSPVAPTPPKMSAPEKEDADVAVAEKTDSTSLLEPLFMHQLKDMYYAERRMVEVMSEWMQACNSEELEETVFNHQKETERQTKRLEKIFKMLNKEPEEKKCEALEGLIKEARDMQELTGPDSAVRDAAIILSLQKIEHYEMGTYAGLLELALTMKLHNIAPLLDKSLKEEEDADEALTNVAEQYIQIRSM